MKNKITHREFNEIKRRLESVSHTWSDLWLFLSLTDIKISEAIELKQTDIEGNTLYFTQKKSTERITLNISPDALEIIKNRKKLNPNDKYVFQSHSNRVKYKERPVTVIAFNTALRSIGKSIGLHKISSKHAKYKA
ncbi:hypothetical protein WH357_21225 [Enterobacter ludwigii]